MTQIEVLQQTGWRRVGSRFVGAPAREVSRLHALRIPPAWTHVAVAKSPRAKLLAVGKDKKGRWQYRYSEKAVRAREQKKFDKLVHFGKAMPRLRAYVSRNLGSKGLGRDRVMAAILHILSTCFMRPGSSVYAKENGSFGIATLQNRHASVHGDTVVFKYRGKAGKEQVRELKDRRIARIVRELKKLPGRDLFQYVADDGAIVNIRRRHINDVIKEVMGERFSAKDFRTWAGTLLAACALAKTKVEKYSDRRKLAVAAVKETAAQLGNTPAVCRKSYIWPSVLSCFEQGRVLEKCAGPAAEKALLRLLQPQFTIH